MGQQDPSWEGLLFFARRAFSFSCGTKFSPDTNTELPHIHHSHTHPFNFNYGQLTIENFLAFCAGSFSLRHLSTRFEDFEKHSRTFTSYFQGCINKNQEDRTLFISRINSEIERFHKSRPPWCKCHFLY
jgi:hypothetical protein